MFADVIEISPCAQVHNRVGPGSDRRLQFDKFQVQVGQVTRGADVGVGLGLQTFTDAPGGGKRALAVGRYDHPPRGHLLAQGLGLYALGLGHGTQFIRQFACSCPLYLSHDLVTSRFNVSHSGRG